MELPLFPLNSVLFPGMPLQLRIFEEHYKSMINECIDTQRPFGVVLIKTGHAERGPIARPYQVGTTAYVRQVKRLPYGHMNIVAIGRDRFKIRAIDTSRSYLVGDVRLMPFSDRNQELLQLAGSKLRPLVERYLEGLQQARQVQFDTDQIPAETMPLAYLAAVLLQTDNDHKQALLESKSTRSFLIDLIRCYQKELTLMDVLLAPSQAEEENLSVFSLN